MFCDALADDSQAFFWAGGHRECDGVAVDAKLADLALAADIGDFDAVGGEEAGDFLVAGVTAHITGL